MSRRTKIAACVAPLAICGIVCPLSLFIFIVSLVGLFWSAIELSKTFGV